MLRLISLIFLTLVIAFITACAPTSRMEYAYSTPEASADKMCLSKCLNGKFSCERICRLKKQGCLDRAKRSVLTGVKSYSCNKLCNCVTSYNTCFTACGGVVAERKMTFIPVAEKPQAYAPIAQSKPQTQTQYYAPVVSL